MGCTLVRPVQGLGLWRGKKTKIQKSNKDTKYIPWGVSREARGTAPVSPGTFSRCPVEETTDQGKIRTFPWPTSQTHPVSRIQRTSLTGHITSEAFFPKIYFAFFFFQAKIGISPDFSPPKRNDENSDSRFSEESRASLGLICCPARFRTLLLRFLEKTCFLRKKWTFQEKTCGG